MTKTPPPSQKLQLPTKVRKEFQEKENEPLSTSLNRRSENIRVKAVIIPELELGDIEREIFGAIEAEGNQSRAPIGWPERQPLALSER